MVSLNYSAEEFLKIMMTLDFEKFEDGCDLNGPRSDRTYHAHPAFWLVQGETTSSTLWSPNFLFLSKVLTEPTIH
jgi:hypothetical protein